MTKRLSAEEERQLIDLRRAGRTFADIAQITGFSYTFVKRRLRKLLTKEELEQIRKQGYSNPEFIDKQKHAQKLAASRIPEEKARIRNERLKRQSQIQSEKIKTGAFQWRAEEIARRSLHGKRIGHTSKHVAAMKKFARERKKYFPDVIAAHLDSLGVQYVCEDLSSSERSVRFIWPDGKTRQMQIKKAMLLSEIPYPVISVGESQMLEWVRSLGLSAGKRRLLNREIDIFIPELNIGIEYNGMFWHSESAVSRSYHLEKTSAFQAVGIRIIHIFEHEWNTRQDQVKRFLESQFLRTSASSPQIDFRLCSVSVVSEFLDSTSIRPEGHSEEFAIVGRSASDLVCAASFARSEYDCAVALKRFSSHSADFRTAVSAMSVFASSVLAEDLIVHVDGRLYDASHFTESGWELVDRLPPRPSFWSRKYGWIDSRRDANTLVIWDCGFSVLRFRAARGSDAN